MIKLSESDKVTVEDTVNNESFGAAVAFVRVKYNCSDDEAINAVDEVVNPGVGAIANTPPTDPEDGDRFNADFYGGSR